MDQILSYLPAQEGLLPKWLLFISVVSIGNSIQAYTSLAGSRKVYSGAAPTSPNPVNGLSARTFGTWTALSSVVRLYGAYHINEPAIYELCLWTFGFAFAHFFAEWFVYGSTRWGSGLAGPVFVSVGTGTWMLMQWSSYVR